MTRSEKNLAGLLALVCVLTSGFAWYQYNRAEKAQNQIDLTATRVLYEVFIAKSDLRVGQLSGEIIASSNYDGMVFRPNQQTKAPVTVNYFINLEKIRQGDIDWDPKNHRLTVRIPEIETEAPNIDFVHAEIKQNGVWIGRGAGIIMQRQGVKRIVARATERAKDAKNIARARRRAVELMNQLVKRPLTAVGYAPVEVRILAPWNADQSGEMWDTSRSLDEVLRNAR